MIDVEQTREDANEHAPLFVSFLFSSLFRMYVSLPVRVVESRVFSFFFFFFLFFYSVRYRMVVVVEATTNTPNGDDDDDDKERARKRKTSTKCLQTICSNHNQINCTTKILNK